MYSRLGDGFKSNHTLLKEVVRNPRSSSNSSRLSAVESSRVEKESYQRQSKREMLERLIANLERVVDQYTELPIILKGQLNSIIKLGKRIVTGGGRQSRQNRENKQNVSVNHLSRQASRQKLVILDRLKTQSQVQVLMQKLIKSKEKRVKLADENFILKGRIQQLNKEEQRLKKMVQNQNQLIQSCIKQIDKLKLKNASAECDQDLLSMITLQAEELEKMMRRSKLKR